MPFRSRSERRLARPRRLRSILAVSLVALFPLLSFPVVGSIAVSGTVIVGEGRVIDEDLFASGGRVFVEGTVDGDLIVVARRLVVSGEVTGDILGLVWDAEIGGEVGGSVRLTAWKIDQTGTVGDDVMTLSRSLDVDGGVGRDALALGWSMSLGGQVGRDVRGEFIWGFTLDGEVGRSVEVGAHRVKVGDDAVVGTDFAYREGLIGTQIRAWDSTADISDAAVINGQLVEREAMGLSVQSRGWLVFFHIMRFISLLIIGILLLGLFPGFGTSAADQAARRPGRSLLVGLLVLAAGPVLFLAGIFTLVLLPVTVITTALWLFVLFVAAVPVLVAAGRRFVPYVARRPVGIITAFVVAAVVWRLLRLIPVAGYLIYWVAALWGLGAWGLAAWRGIRDRRKAAVPDDDVAEVPVTPETGEDD